MAFLSDNVLDFGLDYLRLNGEDLHLTTSQITAYAGLAAATLANRPAITIGALVDRAGGGRRAPVAAITDGTITGTGTASHFAIVDETSNEILAAGPLAANQVLTIGNVFALPTFNVGIPDAV